MSILPKLLFYIQFNSKENSAGVFFSWLYIPEKKRSRTANTLMQRRQDCDSGWNHKWSQSLLSTISCGARVRWPDEWHQMEIPRGRVWNKVAYVARNEETIAIGRNEIECLFPPLCQYQLQLKLLPKCERQHLTFLEKNEGDLCDSSVRKGFSYSKSTDHLENIMLSDISQSEKGKHHMISLICGI